MTQISQDDVLHLARLSNLQLSNDEVSSLQHDLEHILEYINQLAELDTEGVEPTYQVTDRENIWREDGLTDKTVTTETLLALAPETAGNQIKVPKVL